MTFESIASKIESQLAALNEDVRGQIMRLTERVAEMQGQLDAVDRRTQDGTKVDASTNAWSRDVVTKLHQELPSFDKHGRVRYEVRTVTSVGATTPVIYPEITPAAAPSYGAVRRMLPTVSIDGAAVFAVSEAAVTGWAAAPQAESSPKTESDVTLTAQTIPVRTIATWIGVSRQALDDVRGLEAFIQSRLLWALEKAIEEQLLLGSGSGENLTGLMTVAQAFDTTLPPTGANHADQLAAAVLQVRQNGFTPSFIVLAPVTAYQLRITKNMQNDYLDYSGLGLPQVIESPAMTAGQFLVGDANQAIIRARQAATIEMASEHADFFTKNLVAIRAEERLALQVLSASAFVKGTLA